jgi:hypothetical protein
MENESIKIQPIGTTGVDSDEFNLQHVVSKESKGKALSEIFHQDQIEQASSSFWERWLPTSIWNRVAGNKADLNNPEQQVNKPIDFAPALDSPENSSTKRISSLPIDELDALERLSVDELVMVLVQSQLQLQELMAKGAKSYFSEIKKLRDLQDVAIGKIKDSIQFDRKVGHYLGYTQTALSTASFVATVATYFTAGAAAPIAALTAGIGGALTTAADKYFEIRKRQGEQESLAVEEERKLYSEALKEQLRRITDLLEKSKSLEELVIQQVNSKSELAGMVINRG